jgi:hypothetical protein
MSYIAAFFGYKLFLLSTYAQSEKMFCNECNHVPLSTAGPDSKLKALKRIAPNTLMNYLRVSPFPLFTEGSGW